MAIPVPILSTVTSASFSRRHSLKRITQARMASPYCAEMASQAKVNQLATRVSRSLMRFLPLVGLVGSLVFLACAVTPEAAEPVAPAPDAARPLRGGGANQIPASGAPIVLDVGK